MLESNIPLQEGKYVLSVLQCPHGHVGAHFPNGFRTVGNRERRVFRCFKEGCHIQFFRPPAVVENSEKAV